jgi:glutamate synthase (NADPH/NADH) small chain
MLKFVQVGQQFPDKRDALERVQDFDEIFKDYARIMAAEQSARCSQCGIPFCQVHCPLHNNIPDWLKLVAEGRMEEAYQLSSATNTYPEICGRICPQDRLCEGNCVIEKGFESVTIGAVERYITDQAFEKGLIRPVEPLADRGESVGIIGSGPAGMAAAERLRRLGYAVEIYDRYDRAGGLLVYGIPNFKLEKHLVARRISLIEQAGVRIHLNFEVGRDASLDDLREKHNAVLIATGVYEARGLSVPGAGLGNIVMAMAFLTASNRKGFGDSVPAFDSGDLNAAGKNVVVLGGGDTAMDCVRTAKRQGARSVKCLYRRDRDNMPGSMREVYHAEEEGIEFIWLANPEAFIGDGVVSGVRAQRVRLGLPDADGRQKPEIIDGSSFSMDCELAILALGFDPEDLPALFGEANLALTNWGTVRTDFRTMSTNLPGVFAAGDIVRGASLVVWAIRDGRDAAESIHHYLHGRRLSAA